VHVSNNGIDFSNVQSALYRYYVDPTLTLLVPAAGPEVGGTAVTVYASSGGFFESPAHSYSHSGSTGLLKCKFGELEVAATLVSASALSCVAPSIPSGSSMSMDGLGRVVSLSVTMNNLDFSVSPLSYTFKNTPTVSQVLPAFGIVGGGGIVTVVGSNFEDTDKSRDDVFCKFGEIVTPATVISSTAVTCIAPNNVAGTYTVEITNHGGSNSSSSADSLNYVRDDAQWTKDGILFSYLRPFSVSNISPRHGGKEGGTTLTVSGYDFADIDSLCCVFDGTNIVAAAYVNTNEISCVTPAHSSSPKISSFGIGSCTSSLALSGYLHTALLQFAFVASPTLTNVSPARGIISGGTTVTLNGNNFYQHKDDDHITCRFGGLSGSIVAAKYVSRNAVECQTPVATKKIDEMREVQTIHVVSQAAAVEVQKISVVGTPLN
jgi:hypothetical protein